MLRRYWIGGLLVLGGVLAGLALLLLAGPAQAQLPASQAGAPPPPAAPQGPLQGTPTATPSCGGPATWLAGPTHDPARELFQGTLASDGKFYEAGGQSPDGTLSPPMWPGITRAPMPGRRSRRCRCRWPRTRWAPTAASSSSPPGVRSARRRLCHYDHAADLRHRQQLLELWRPASRSGGSRRRRRPQRQVLCDRRR